MECILHSRRAHVVAGSQISVEAYHDATEAITASCFQTRAIEMACEVVS